MLACVSCSSGGGSKATPPEPEPEPVAVVAGAVGIPPGTPLTFEILSGARPRASTPHEGPDGIAGNGDDRAVQRTEIVYEASRETETTTSCGPDYVLGTADDHVWDVWVSTLGSDGRLLQQDHLIDVHGDGAPVPYFRWTYTYDERGMLASHHWALSRGDWRFGTRDDFAMSDATYLTDR